MCRLFTCVLGGLMAVVIPQNLWAEQPDGPQGPRPIKSVGTNPETLFNQLDANHDGVITEDELPPGMPEVMKQLLFLADSNGDGKITKDEFTAAFTKQRPGPGRDMPPFGQRFRGPDGQHGQMAGPPFGRPGMEMGPGPMARQGFGGPEGQHDRFAGPPPQSGTGKIDTSLRVAVYALKELDPQTTLKAMQTLLAGVPEVRMDVDPKTNHLIVIARPKQHAQIQAVLERMQPGTKQAEASVQRTPGRPHNESNERADRTPGPRFGGPEGRFGQMAGPRFNGPEMGYGWMQGQRFGGPGPGPGRMAGYYFDGPDGRHGEMSGPPFDGPDGRHPPMAGPNFQGPDAESHHNMRGSPFNGPEGRPWAGPGYGPPQHWAAFGPMQQGPWQHHGHFGPPNHHQWQADYQRHNRPWMAYGAWDQRPWQHYGHWGSPNRHWQANYERPQHPQFNLKAVFERLDTNHDNQLSFEEFSQGMKQLMHSFVHSPGHQWARPVGFHGGQGYGQHANHDMANAPASRVDQGDKKASETPPDKVKTN
jgi:hypothetical protein